MRRDGPIQVLIIESSPRFRTRVAAALAVHSDLHVLPAAVSTDEARESVIEFHPDVIVLDLELRRGDALAFLRKLREHYPVPTFVTSESGATDAPRAMKAVEIGALEVIRKPANGERDDFHVLANRLADRIREAFLRARPVPPPRVRRPAQPASWRAAGLDPNKYIVAIGASTGGTEAIRALLSSAPADFPPIMITQHMPANFTRSFAQRLDQLSPFTVTEAEGGERLASGMAVVARGDTHLELRRDGRGWRVEYSHQTPVNNHCPSVDVMFDSVAKHGGEQAIGVLMTGMGGDGARGLANLRRNGAITLAQDQASCVVFGMPKVAVDLGAVMDLGEPSVLATMALRLAQRRKRDRLARAVRGGER